MSLFVRIQKNLGDFHLDVCLENDGGVLGILGASGCGKSYTLKCIAGVERPDSGEIIVNNVILYRGQRKTNKLHGNPAITEKPCGNWHPERTQYQTGQDKINICLPPQKRKVGYLFQNYALFPHMTVSQNILCGLHDVKDRRQKQYALEEITALLRLRGLERLYPAQLSGGQAQRTALARILVSRPRLLMLDEPFSALDSHLRETLQVELQELLSRIGTDILLVTHDGNEAYRLCQRIAVMDKGKLLTAQENRQLFANPGSVRAAELTGCKNHAPAVKTDTHTVYIPDWNIYLTTEKTVPDSLKAVGIRAHDFQPGNICSEHTYSENLYPVQFVGEMEEPFTWIFLFRFAGQEPHSQPLRWQIAKEQLRGYRPYDRPAQLSVAPANILLLYA